MFTARYELSLHMLFALKSYRLFLKHNLNINLFASDLPVIALNICVVILFILVTYKFHVLQNFVCAYVLCPCQKLHLT